MDNKFKMGAMLQRIEVMKRELPVILANQAQNHFAHSFNEHGFEGKQWPEVQRRIPGTNAYKYPKNKDLGRRTRAINVKSGVLRRAVGTSIRSVSFKKTELIVAVPYAKYLNEGTNHIPERPFIKQGPELTKMQRERIKRYFKKVWLV